VVAGMSDVGRRADTTLATWAAIYLGVAAATLPSVLPVMVGVLADNLAFGAVRAGYVASANMIGVALGSVICTVAARRWSWQSLIRAGAAAMIGANLLTTLVAAFPQVATLRLVSGLGEGIVGAICYAAMGRSRRPARALAFYIAGQGLVGALGMGAIPTVVARAGWPWLFVLVSLVALPAFWLAKPIETLRTEPTEEAGANVPAATWLSWYALTGIFVFALGMSAVWAFVERIGHSKAIDLAHLSGSLSAAAIANMAGSLLVGFAAHRLGAAAGIATGYSLVSAGLVALASSGGWPLFLVAIALIFFAWGFYIPFQFTLLARVDAVGHRTLLIPLVTGGGLTLGPAIGGLLIAAGGTSAVCIFGFACVTASTASALHLRFQQKRLCHE
jgi:predicted MFS family arabinose efflux permease